VNRADDADVTIKAIAALPTLAPDARRARMIRARCRASLERPTAGEWISTMVSVGVSAVWAIYAWHLARAAMSLAR
jgi:hypothetical protein